MKTLMKRFLATILACACSLAFAACGDKKDKNEPTTSAPTESVSESSLVAESTDESTTDKTETTEATKATDTKKQSTTEKKTDTKPNNESTKEAETTTNQSNRGPLKSNNSNNGERQQVTTEPAKQQSDRGQQNTTPKQTTATTKQTTPKQTTTVTTAPPVTDPPVTQPPATDPPVTDPPATQPPSFDPSTYNWPAVVWGDVDTNMANYTVNNTLYLGQLIKTLTNKFTEQDPGFTDLTEYSLTDSSIDIRQYVWSTYTNDPFMDYKYSYSRGNYSRFIMEDYNSYYEYLFSGGSSDSIHVDLNGQTGDFPKNEIRVYVGSMTIGHGGFSDDMVNFGYNRIYY